MAHSKTAKHRVVQWPVEAPSTPTVKSPTATEKTAGRISHDERGNAVFKPRSGDSTSTMLKRLELPDLKVEGQEEARAPSRTAAVPSKAQKPQPSRPEPGGGYNPYDQSRAVKKPTTPKGPVGRRTR
jgi:hypothetical protein